MKAQVSRPKRTVFKEQIQIFMIDDDKKEEPKKLGINTLV